MDWNHGYNTEGGYTFGHYPETTPSNLHFAALLKGIKAPLSNFRYLDLGCGQGYGLLLTAVQHPDSEFVGIDFMPEHIAHARDLAAKAGVANCTFMEADFLELDDSHVLGEFDFIVAHGITTWVSPEVRDAVFRLSRDLLKPGGLMYNGYNTFPGWLAVDPFRSLVIQLSEQHNSTACFEKALGYMSDLSGGSDQLFKSFPNLKLRLDDLRSQDPAYVSQEYGNRFSRPVYSVEMLNIASKNKLQFIGSAFLPELFDSCYPSKLIEIINSTREITLRETLRDYGIVQNFRRDIYVKGPRKLWLEEQKSELMSLEFVHVPVVRLPQEGQPFKVTSTLGLEGERNAYLQLLNAFGIDGCNVSKAQEKCPNLKVENIFLMCAFLTSGGWLAVKNQGDVEGVKALNRVILRAALAGAPYKHIGLGAAKKSQMLSDIDLLILALCYRSKPDYDSEAIARTLCEIMISKGQNFIENGVPVSDKQKMKLNSKKIVDNFLVSALPVFEKLEIL